MPHRRSLLLRHAAIAGLVVGTISARAAAQPPADAGANQIWARAAQVHEIKNQFVDAIRQFAEAMSGTFGDEGRQLVSSLDAVDRIHQQWDAAIREYESALTRLAESAEVHVALGTVYLDRQRIDDALRELAAAGRLDPRRADVHTLSALAYGLGGRFAEAGDALQRAAVLDAGNPISLYGLAQYLNRSGRREQAAEALRMFHESLQGRLLALGGSVQAPAPFDRVSLLRQVAGVAPIFPLHMYRQGFGLLLAGQYDQAVAELRRAATQDPIVAGSSGGTAARAAAAGSALRRAQIPLALGELEGAVGDEPNRSEGRRVLGVALWADGQYEKSVTQLRAALALAPQDERVRLALADVLVDAGRAAEAEQTLADTVRAIPDSGAAHFRLGQLYQRQSLLPRAVQEFETAATLDPLTGTDRLYETIGGLYSNQADFDAVIDAYGKRIDANPNNADGHVKLGEIYFLQGRDDEALAEFLAALLIDPRIADALAGAAQVYLRMGRYPDALEAARRAIASDVRHRSAHYALGTALLRLGRPEEGRRELEIFQRMQADAIAAAQRESELKALRLNAARRFSDGDFATAATLLRQALTHDSNDAAVHRDLGAALIKGGRFAEAIVVLDQSLTLEDTAEAHELLAEADAALNRPADSQAQLALAARALARLKEDRLRRIRGSR